MSPQEQLVQALAAAKKRIRVKPKADERQPGTGTNEAGPAVQTNAPPNEWNTDGDSNG